MNCIQRQRAQQVGWLVTKQAAEVNGRFIALDLNLDGAVVAPFTQQDHERE
jgi:hypothetical protein